MIRDFLSGASAYGHALELLGKHRLWGYVIVPALISAALGILIFVTAWSLSDDIGQVVMNWYPWEWGKAVFEKIFSVAGGLLVVLLGLLIYKNLVMILAGPFMSFLSEKVENIISGKNSGGTLSIPRFARDLVRGLTIAVRNLIRELFFTLLLLLLGLIPVFSPFTTALIFAIQAFYAGFNNFDFFLERHYGVRGSVRFVRRNRWLVMGNGAVFILLLLTGIGFLIAPVLGVVAATREGMPRLMEP